MSRSVRKGFVYRVLGERAGRVVVSFWNWLWGRPVDEGGTLSVRVAEQAVRDIQASVQRLSEAVAAQVGAYRRAQQLYQQKVSEYRSCQEQALAAKNAGRMDLARLALGKALAVEQILPELADRVRQAEAFAEAARERLAREQQQLEQYRARLQNLKDLHAVNAALLEMVRVSEQYDIGAARSQFEEANAAVERRHFETEALSALKLPPDQVADEELRRIALDAELDRRLRLLGEPGESGNSKSA